MLYRHYTTHTSQQPSAVGTHFPMLQKKKQRFRVCQKVARNDTASGKQSQDFSSIHFQFTLFTRYKSAMSNVQKDCVLFVCLELEHVFSEKQFLVGRSPRSTPRGLFMHCCCSNFTCRNKMFP